MGQRFGRRFNWPSTIDYQCFYRFMTLKGDIIMGTISKSEYDNITSLYKNGMKMQDIALRYNVHYSVIWRIISKCGLTKKDRKGLLDLLDSKKIKDLYNDGLSTKSIAEQLNVSAESIRRVLKREGVERRHSLYSVNEHYFDVIDSQDKAYFMGLLYADGYNDPTKNLIVITLHDRDKHILESFNQCVQNTRPLRFINKSAQNPNWSDCYELIIVNHHMSSMLEKYGVVKAKSMILQFPDWIDRKLLPHFLRGYMDGDGHIAKAQYKYNAEFVGTEMFCNRVVQLMEEEIGISAYVYKPNPEKTTTIVKFCNKANSVTFLDYIYKDANLYLKRKFDIYQLKYYHNKDINNTLSA